MNPFVISKKQRIINVGVLSVALAAMSAWRAMTPDPNNARQIYDVENHPIASALGAALPAVILAPVAYWLYGWCFAALANRRASREAERTPGVGQIWSAATSEALHRSETETNIDNKESWAAWYFGVNIEAPAEREELAEAKRSEPVTNLNDEESWAAAIKEFDSGSRRLGLYAKLYANFEGDDSKIKATYLKTRVVEMAQEAQKQSALAREAQAREALAVQEAAAVVEADRALARPRRLRYRSRNG